MHFPDEIGSQAGDICSKWPHHHRGELSIVIKTTFRCNCRCRYCSTGPKSSSVPDLTLEIVRRLYEEVGTYACESGICKINLLWHGGEPLLLGKDFYAAAWGDSIRLTEAGVTVKHFIQTNLLLLDRDWLELFGKFEIAIGTSVDPIGEDRVTRDGKPQYPEWFEKFSQLCSENLPLGIVFTVTSRHEGCAANIYNFFKNLQFFSNLGIGVRVNPVHITEISSIEAEQAIAPADFGEFLFEVWRLWTEDGRRFSISPLDGWAKGEPQTCEFHGHCGQHFLAIDGRGDFYPCGRFADTGITLGNIRKVNLSTILRQPFWLQLAKRDQHLQLGQCGNCLFWKFCHGGCPAMAALYFGDSSKASPFCKGYRVFFEKSGIADLSKPGRSL